MFRKLIVAAGLGFVVCTAVPPPVGAADPPAAAPLHATYELWYRTDHHHAWRLYGSYHSHRAADHAADHLRGQGYEVRIDTH